MQCKKDGNSIAQQLCDAFEVCRQDKQMKTIDTFVIIEDDIKYDIRKPLWIYTVFWLIHRNFLIVTRDPTIQKLQIVQKVVSSFVLDRHILFLSLKAISSEIVCTFICRQLL